MRNSIVEKFEQKVFKQAKTHPKFRPGDTIKVHYKIEEAAKSSKDEKKYRIQVYEGVCIRFKKGLGNAAFTVRKMGANSVGVERVFPLYSPMVDRIDVLAGGRVRRARLYYLRNLTGKSARIQTRRLPANTVTTTVANTSGTAE
jgi:large subunit ribosomal protein L19